MRQRRMPDFEARGSRADADVSGGIKTMADRVRDRALSEIGAAGPDGYMMRSSHVLHA
jgi:hypothetical protein